MLAEAVYIALSFILGRITIFRMPQGGSVTAGQMIPLILFALRWGVGPGILAGMVYGLLDAMMGGTVLGIIQFLLDYPIAFGALGFAGVFTKSFKKAPTTGQLVWGTILAVLGRMFFSTISGVVFFGQYAPAGTSPWVYSLTYQISYLGVELLIVLVVVILLRNVIFRLQR